MDEHPFAPSTGNIGPWVYWISTWDTQAKPVAMTSLRELRTVRTVQEFWCAHSELPVQRVPRCSTLHLFREGIEPVYTHPANACGGHFKIRCHSLPAATELWAPLTLSMVTEALSDNATDVNGIAFAHTQRTTTLNVWVVNSMDVLGIGKLHTKLEQTCNPNRYQTMKFLPHKYLQQTIDNQRVKEEPQCTEALTTEQLPTAPASSGCGYWTSPDASLSYPTSYPTVGTYTTTTPTTPTLATNTTTAPAYPSPSYPVTLLNPPPPVPRVRPNLPDLLAHLGKRSGSVVTSEDAAALLQALQLFPIEKDTDAQGNVHLHVHVHQEDLRGMEYPTPPPNTTHAVYGQPEFTNDPYYYPAWSEQLA